MHGADGGPPEGNENAVSHGGYAKPNMPLEVRQAYMLRRQNRLDEALEEALDNENRRRAFRIIDLLCKNDFLMSRAVARWRRSLPSHD